MKGKHEYNPDCQCYRCKGIRNNPAISKQAKRRRVSHNATREEQHARYIECGPSAWDDRD